MQYTSNLNLKKPDSTDYVNVSDLNDNMDIIDQTITEISDSSSGIEQQLAEHLADDTRHVNQQLKDDIRLGYNIAQETQIELKAFKSALTEGFTANQFSDGLTTLDAFNVTAGYYNQSLSRMEV